MIDNFNRLRQEYDGSAFLTEEQRQWANMQRLLNSIKLTVHHDRPNNKLRGAVFDLVSAPAFDLFIMGAILVNTLVMTLEHWRMSEGWVDFMFAANMRECRSVVCVCAAVQQVLLCIDSAPQCSSPSLPLRRSSRSPR